MHAGNPADRSYAPCGTNELQVPGARGPILVRGQVGKRGRGDCSAEEEKISRGPPAPTSMSSRSTRSGAKRRHPCCQGGARRPGHPESSQKQTACRRGRGRKACKFAGDQDRLRARPAPIAVALTGSTRWERAPKQNEIGRDALTTGGGVGD